MVAYIKEMSVGHKKWLDEESFKDGVVLCQSIPGATAMQTAAYVGMRAREVPGALLSFVSFGMPAFILMLVLSSLYARYHAAPRMISLFNGLQAVVVAIVANATFLFGKTTFKDYKGVTIALAASALFWAGISPFLVISGAAIAGMGILNTRDSPVPAHGRKSLRHNSFKPILVLSVGIVSGLLVLFLVDKKLFNLAALMMKIDLFAFGGGFASVPLMLHEIVNVKGWMDSKTFMDGIALGQVTPGPIVITSTFVGYMIYGMAGAFLATMAVFTPSFFMVVTLTPIMDRFRASAFFLRITKGILASFVGLLFYVTVKFALAVPWDLIRVVLVCAAFTAPLKKVDILYVVLITAVVSLFIF
jgi:chromate transporter